MNINDKIPEILKRLPTYESILTSFNVKKHKGAIGGAVEPGNVYLTKNDIFALVTDVKVIISSDSKDPKDFRVRILFDKYKKGDDQFSSGSGIALFHEFVQFIKTGELKTSLKGPYDRFIPLPKNDK